MTAGGMANFQWPIANCQRGRRRFGYSRRQSSVDPCINGVSCTRERLMGQAVAAHGKRPFLPPHAFSTLPPSASAGSARNRNGRSPCSPPLTGSDRQRLAVRQTETAVPRPFPFSNCQPLPSQLPASGAATTAVHGRGRTTGQTEIPTHPLPLLFRTRCFFNALLCETLVTFVAACSGPPRQNSLRL